MTTRTKRLLFAATTLLALLTFLWMRSVAYWRPVKVARVNIPYADYYRGLQGGSRGCTFLSDDEQFALLSPWDDLFIDALDLRDKSRILWKVEATFIVSRQSPESVFVFNPNEGKDSLRARDLRSGRLKRMYRWPVLPKDYAPSLLLSPDEKTLWAVDSGRLFAWDVQSGHLLHQTTLKHPFDSNSPAEISFVLSPDGTHLLGCQERKARLWHLPSGVETTSWTVKASLHAVPYAFSPNGRVVIYMDFSVGKTYPVLFVDAATGKLLWQTTKYDVSKRAMSNDEIFVPEKNNCRVLDLFTGRPKRELSFPRHSDGEILRVTPDYIYTLNTKAEILRWHAR